MKLVGMLMAYNEVRSGFLYPCLESLSRYCDEIVVYDDASTDGSQMVYEMFDCYVIHGRKNNFQHELGHKQQQLEVCKSIGADWILRIDADEILDERAIGKSKDSSPLRKLLMETNKPSFAFHTINLWRSPCFYRLDNSYNSVIFNRLWRCTPDLHFDIAKGLHLTNYPVGVTENEGFAPWEILHYGFASNDAILDKYRMYVAHGQSGWQLDRLINESTLKLARSKQEWFEHKLPNHKFEEVFMIPVASEI